MKIGIGIQVRLSSNRLAAKAIKEIDGQTILSHLLDRVFNSFDWVTITDNNRRKDLVVALLVPEEELNHWITFSNNYKRKISLVAGDMDNVFSRYDAFVTQFGLAYVIRLTGDCPFLKASLLSKVINMGSSYKYDYLTNTFEDFRTMPDGMDVEFISRRCWEWLRKCMERATVSDHEHVTTFLKRHIFDEPWLNKGQISNFIDESALKYSIDTLEEYERIRALYYSKKLKDKLACEKGIKIHEY